MVAVIGQPELSQKEKNIHPSSKPLLPYLYTLPKVAVGKAGLPAFS